MALSTPIVSTFVHADAPFLYWIGLASAQSGAVQFAISHNKTTRVGITGRSSIYKSNNFGASWAQLEGFPYNATLAKFGGLQAVACDAYCQTVMVAAYNAGIYISTNFGTNWSVSIFSRLVGLVNGWNSVSCDSSGVYLAAAGSYGNIIVSSNSGLSWNNSSAPFSTVIGMVYLLVELVNISQL